MKTLKHLVLVIILIAGLLVSCSPNRIQTDSPQEKLKPRESSELKPRESSEQLDESPWRKSSQLSEIIEGEWVMLSAKIKGSDMFPTISFIDKSNCELTTYYSNWMALLNLTDEVTSLEYEIRDNKIHLYTEDDDWLIWQPTIIDENTIRIANVSYGEESDSFILERCYITPSENHGNVYIEGVWEADEEASHVLTFNRGGKLETNEKGSFEGYGLASYKIEEKKLIVEEIYSEELLKVFSFIESDIYEASAICQPEICLYSPSLLILEWNEDGSSIRSHIYLSDSESINHSFDDERLLKRDDPANKRVFAEWAGEYNELYTYAYSHMTGEKSYSKDTLESQNTPYIHLHEDGSYEFNLNIYNEMALVTGTWEVDRNNNNIVYIFKPDNVSVDSFERIIMERVSDEVIVLRGADGISLGDYGTTSTYGDVYVKQDALKSNHYEKQYHFSDWARLYIDFYPRSLQYTEGIMLHDLNGDRVPELFIDYGYETMHVYSIKDDEVFYLDEIIRGKADIRRDLKTKKEKMFISSRLEGGGGAYYLSSVEMESRNIVYEILFSEQYDFETYFDEGEEMHEEAIHEYFLNEKDKTETLEEAMMDYESHKVDKEIYEKAMADFKNSHELIRKVKLYEVDTSSSDDWDNLDMELEIFRDAIDNYIVSNPSTNNR